MKHTVNRRLLETVAIALFGALLTLPSSAFADGVLKVGLDGSGSANFTVTNTSLSNSYTVDSGMSMAIEGQWPLGDNVDAGGGIGFMTYRQLTNYPGAGSMSFMPLYLKMRLHPKIDPQGATPYLNVELGLSVFNADSTLTNNGYLTPTGGGHFGFGGGVQFSKDFLAELMFTYDSGSLDYGGSSVIDVGYSKMTLSIGAIF